VQHLRYERNRDFQKWLSQYAYSAKSNVEFLLKRLNVILCPSNNGDRHQHYFDIMYSYWDITKKEGFSVMAALIGILGDCPRMTEWHYSGSWNAQFGGIETAKNFLRQVLQGYRSLPPDYFKQNKKYICANSWPRVPW